jgi:hypothetical protein
MTPPELFMIKVDWLIWLPVSVPPVKVEFDIAAAMIAPPLMVALLTATPVS